MDRRYFLIRRNEFLTPDAQAIDDMIDGLGPAVAQLREMRDDGASPEGGSDSDFAMLVTSDPSVAEKHGFSEEDFFEEGNLEDEDTDFEHHPFAADGRKKAEATRSRAAPPGCEEEIEKGFAEKSLELESCPSPAHAGESTEAPLSSRAACPGCEEEIEIEARVERRENPEIAGQPQSWRHMWGDWCSPFESMSQLRKGDQNASHEEERRFTIRIPGASWAWEAASPLGRRTACTME